MENQIRIIFMGTPEFAVPSLKILVENNYNVVAVITAPDKPSGRGLHKHQSPVKQFAVQHNIPVLQPEKLKSYDLIEKLKSFQADLQIVVAFRMLPEIIWNMPRLGTINLHASLLPDYRGAAPIHHAIIQGETKTGLTTFFLQHAIDTGDIIFQESIDIDDADNAGTLHDKLMHAGALLVLKTVKAIQTSTFTLQKQSGNSQKIAPKIFKQDCEINWNKNVTEIYNFIRGLSPHPGAYSTIQDTQIKIFNSKPEIANHSELPGSYSTDHKSYLKIACKDGFIYANEVQEAGKKRMLISDYLKGHLK